jgi:hypothetical protein
MQSNAFSIISCSKFWLSKNVRLSLNVSIGNVFSLIIVFPSSILVLVNSQTSCCFSAAAVSSLLLIFILVVVSSVHLPLCSHHVRQIVVSLAIKLTSPFSPELSLLGGMQFRGCWSWWFMLKNRRDIDHVCFHIAVEMCWTGSMSNYIESLFHYDWFFWNGKKVQLFFLVSNWMFKTMCNTALYISTIIIG